MSFIKPFNKPADMPSTTGHAGAKPAEAFSFLPAQQQQMLSLARDSIKHGLHHHSPKPVELDSYAPLLQQPGCCFVTLHKSGKLRGCIGALAPSQPLIKDIADHAYAAAFEDPRFPKLMAHELAELQIEISVLTPQVELSFASEEELLAQLTPFEDGLTLEDKHYRGTFLPVVWQQLPEKINFLRQLKLKAGMPPNYWSPTLKAYRYHSVMIREQDLFNRF